MESESRRGQKRNTLLEQSGGEINGEKGQEGERVGKASRSLPDGSGLYQATAALH